jgi:hypothetical protein
LIVGILIGFFVGPVGEPLANGPFRCGTASGGVIRVLRLFGEGYERRGIAAAREG